MLTYPFACTLATLRIMLNITEISHDLIFFKVSAFAFFSEISCFLMILYGTKIISFVIREQVLHIKIGRIFVKRATAYVESFCRRYTRKQVINNACSSFLYRHPLENFHVQHTNAFHLSDDSAVCALQY